MNHKIQRKSNAMCAHPRDNLPLLPERSRSGNFARGILAQALKTQLKVIQPGVHQFSESPFLQRHPRCNQIYIQSGTSRGPHQLHQIRSRQRLTASEIDLQNPRFPSLPQHARPYFRRKLESTKPKLQRIRAIDTVQWAAVRKLSDQRKRMVNDRSHDCPVVSSIVKSKARWSCSSVRYPRISFSTRSASAFE